MQGSKHRCLGPLLLTRTVPPHGECLVNACLINESVQGKQECTTMLGRVISFWVLGSTRLLSSHIPENLSSWSGGSQPTDCEFSTLSSRANSAPRLPCSEDCTRPCWCHLPLTCSRDCPWTHQELFPQRYFKPLGYGCHLASCLLCTISDH